MITTAVFDTKPYDREPLQQASAKGSIGWRFLDVRLTKETAPLAKDAQAVCVFVNDHLDRPCLEALAAQGVKLVALRCTGFNNVDVAAAKALKLAVTRVPVYSPYSVAEYTVALLLALNRKIHRAYNRVRELNFALNGLVGFDLHGKTAGICGTGNNDPALGYSVAYPFGFIAPILCMYFANLWIKRKVMTPAAGLDHREVVVRNPRVIGRPLAEVLAQLPAGVRIFAVRTGNQNRVPSPDIVLADNDVVALAGESEAAIEGARLLIGEAAAGQISADRGDLDYFRLFVSRPAVVGVSLADLRIPGVPEFSVMHVRRGDADLLPRPELVLEFGDRVGIMLSREHRDAARKHFGDSIKGTTEFSYVSLGVGMALGVLLGVLPLPIPGLGSLCLGVAGGPLIVGLILGRLARTGGWVWTMPPSANIILRNFGLTVFLAQVGMTSGPKFLETVAQTGPIFLAVGAAMVLVAVLFNLLVGHFFFRLNFDELLGATCGVAANPAQMVFASKLTASDRTDVVYAMTFPTGTIMKILLLQVMLAMMGKS